MITTNSGLLLLRKLSTKIFLFIGIINMPVISAASYTHFLSYSNIDNDGLAQLEGVITFNDQHSDAQQDTSGLGGTINNSFITSITFRYTPSGGSTSTITESNVGFYNMIRSNSSATTDYDGDPTLKSQLTKLQFGGSGGAFSLTMDGGTGGEFDLQADLTGTDTKDDFRLIDTQQFPAPLPILALIPALSSIRKLKKRYQITFKK